MSYMFIVVFMINVFYKQHLVSHYNKPAFEKVLFYMLRRKKTEQKTQPRPFTGRIWSSEEWIVSFPVFLIHLPFWQTCTWSAIWTCEFFINSKTDIFPLSSVCNCWEPDHFLSFPTCSYSLIHFIHLMTHEFSLSGLVPLHLLSQCWKPKASPRPQNQPPFAFFIIHLYTLQWLFWIVAE